MKNAFKKLTILSIAILLLGACSNKDNSSSGDNNNNPPKEDDTPQEVDREYFINASYPLNNGKASLMNDDVTDFYNNYSFTSSMDYVDGTNHYQRKPLTISWTVKEEALYYLVEFANNSVFQNEDTYLCNQKSLELDDLNPGESYYWRVNAYYQTKIIRSQTFEFETLSIPKTYYLDTIGNFRDLGGFKTTEGKKTKLGLIYRGANPDNASIEDSGYLKDNLGIKTEIDLRNKNEGKQGLNPISVENYIAVDDYGGCYYDNSPNGISSRSGQIVLAREIKIFANRDNYPIYFHCAIGRDRTGTLALVLNSLLGVEKINIAIDYELSMFAKISTGDVIANPEEMVPALLNQVFIVYNYIYGGYEGKNMQERTIKFLLDIGVTQEEINNILDIMLEDL